MDLCTEWRVLFHSENAIFKMRSKIKNAINFQRFVKEKPAVFFWVLGMLQWDDTNKKVDIKIV